MNRNEKINVLAARADDDVRRPALDRIDEAARRSNVFGSKAHRAARETVEAEHNDTRRAYETFSEAQLDSAIEDGE